MKALNRSLFYTAPGLGFGLCIALALLTPAPAHAQTDMTDIPADIPGDVGDTNAPGGDGDRSSASQSQQGESPMPNHLKGGGSFIQLPPPWYNSLHNGPPETTEQSLDLLWRQDFKNMKSLGLNSLVVQYAVGEDVPFFNGAVALGGANLAPGAGDYSARHSLETIMRNAHDNKMSVWLGLRGKRSWDRQGWSELVRSTEPIVDDSLAVARAIEAGGLPRQYRGSFAGWYITQEIDNTQTADMASAKEAGNAKLKKLVAELKQIDGRPVSISGHFREDKGNLTESQFLDLLEGTLRGSGLSTFIFIDSVGVEDSVQAPLKELSAAQRATLSNRYLKVGAICRKLGIKMWGGVELMVGQADDAPATNIARFTDQMNAVRGAGKILVSDTSRYLIAQGGNANADTLFREYRLKVATHPDKDSEMK